MNMKYLNNYLIAGKCLFLSAEDAEVHAQFKNRLRNEIKEAKIKTKKYLEEKLCEIATATLSQKRTSK